jgi:hypothetical protein
VPAAPAAPSLAKPARPRIASAATPASPPPPVASVPQAFSDERLDEHVASRAESAAVAEAEATVATAQAEDSARTANTAKSLAGAARERQATQEQAIGALADAAPSVAVPAGPMKPATWLAHIRSLRDQQRRAEARASLLEFNRRYPDFVIPSDLAPLLRQ